MSYGLRVDGLHRRDARCRGRDHGGRRDADFDVANRREVLVEPPPVAGAEIRAREEPLNLPAQEVVDALAAAGEQALRLDFGGGRAVARSDRLDDALVRLVGESM